VLDISSPSLDSKRGAVAFLVQICAYQTNPFLSSPLNSPSALTSCMWCIVRCTQSLHLEAIRCTLEQEHNYCPLTIVSFYHADRLVPSLPTLSSFATLSFWLRFDRRNSAILSTSRTCVPQSGSPSSGVFLGALCATRGGSSVHAVLRFSSPASRACLLPAAEWETATLSVESQL